MLPNLRMRGFLLAGLFGLAAGIQAAAAPEYVGSAACLECHADEHAAWAGSHHDLAMQPATAETVLGDFGDVRFEHQGVETRFYRRDGLFLVETEGGDGERREHEIAYTFGVTPLQQYLIAMPNGRYQAFTVAWDSRPEEAGGQRWFHLYPDETIPPGDELHWTAPAHNWNFACAECHSTHLRKNYDSAADSYATEWAEIDVACEACHGPGSRHVEAATAAKENGAAAEYPQDHGLAVNLVGPGVWGFAEGAATATLNAKSQGAAEVELCGRCHARRSQLSEDYAHGHILSDTHRVQLLSEGRYFPDGQILDEVYVYGSFLQSKMHAAGVTCSDCHEPHGLKLRAEGNGVCLRCHSAAAFDTPNHHFHPPGSEGAACVQCHMPERTYMVIDPRRDHSMRIPRPDLSMDLGVPNACNGCHADQDARWAAEAVGKWYGEERKTGYRGYAQALQAGRTGRAGAAVELATVALDDAAPGIVRATALTELGAYLDGETLSAIRQGLEADDPLMRRAAVEALAEIELRSRWQLLSPLLDDPVLSVRLAVASALADIRPEQVGADGAKLQRAFEQYLASQRVNADRAEHWLNIGSFHARQGDAVAADEAYAQALRRNARFVPAYVNRADMYRATGRDAEAGKVLEQAIAAIPDSGSLHHAYGLWLVRDKRTEEALDALARAWGLAPEDARIGYVYGVALESTGDTDQALATWEAVLKVEPNHRETLVSMATTLAREGDSARALLYAQHLARLLPNDARIQRLMSELSSQQGP